MATTKRTHDGWDLRETGPANAAHTVLLLPGGLCSGEFFEDVMAQPALSSMHLVAATVPGFGRTPPPDDVTIENYAILAGKLAADLGCDVVAGHSIGANIALEMAAANTFSGPMVLLSPSYSAADEEKAFRAFARIGRIPIVGPPIWWLAMKSMPSAIKKSFPEARREALLTDLKNNDPAFCRRSVRAYFDYLAKYGEVASRLCDSQVRAWVVRGATTRSRSRTTSVGSSSRARRSPGSRSPRARTCC